MGGSTTRRHWNGSGRLFRAAALGFGSALLGVTLSVISQVLELEEHAGLDRLFVLRGSVGPPEDVVVIGIDRDSADALGVPAALNEWPRSLHAELLDALAAAGAAIVAFDIIFHRPRAPEHDQALALALERAGNAILLERVRSETIGVGGGGHEHAVIESRDLPLEPLKRAALATAPFPLPVVPIRVSQFWTFGRGPGDMPTLPAVALQAYALPVYDTFAGLLREARADHVAHLPPSAAHVRARGELQTVVRDIRQLFSADGSLAGELLARLRELDPPLDAGQKDLLLALLSMYAGDDSRYLSYYGPPRTIRTIPYHQALRDAGALGLDGRMVFVGFSEWRQPEQQDEFYSVFSQRSGMSLSGVEIGATAFANLLERRSIRPLTMRAHVGLVLAWGGVLGAAFALLPPLPALGLAMAAAALYVAAASHLFQTAGVWLPLVVPLLAQLPIALFAALLWHHRLVRIQRERVETALGYYLPARVVNRLAQESLDGGAGRQLLHGICMVTDADGYTTLSERLAPEALGRLMNDYYDVLVGAVDRHGGEVSDIGGDSMVAIWAAARRTPAAIRQACSAALDIHAGLEVFNSSRGELALPTRIGIDSGAVLLANVGAGHRFEYRAVGDIVNTASRLQGLNRQLGTRVLVSARTLEGAPGLCNRRIGSFLLVGKREPLDVHELVSAAVDETSEHRRLLELFATALALFERGRWQQAREAFSRVSALFPADGPSRFYAELCAQYTQMSPPDDWAGAIRISAK